jgi:hypothetical protein
MRLNLPIYDVLAECENILIAGAGGGFDVFAGLPIYFALRDEGKQVHLANYSFSNFDLASMFAELLVLLPDRVVGALPPLRTGLPFAEGYLSQWFRDAHGEEVPVWMFAQTGVAPLIEGYTALADYLKIDAIILVDGGVDSLMRGDEAAPGTLLEDSISLSAVDRLDIPVKLLACLGFGTEVEEQVCHHHALENIAALSKDGAYLGNCALIPQMPAFQQFEAACRFVWELPNHPKSHITTRVIPAVHGEFGNYHMYPDDRMISRMTIFVSPLMSLYWFFDAEGVIKRNLLIEPLRHSLTTREALLDYAALREQLTLRPRQHIPY